MSTKACIREVSTLAVVGFLMSMIAHYGRLEDQCCIYSMYTCIYHPRLIPDHCPIPLGGTHACTHTHMHTHTCTHTCTHTHTHTHTPSYLCTPVLIECSPFRYACILQINSNTATNPVSIRQINLLNLPVGKYNVDMCTLLVSS